MNKSGASQDQSASELISKRIAELGDWRGATLSRVRKLIKEADPDVVEEWKWVKPTRPGTPVWSHDGIICTGESYKAVVKLTFAKGASLKDPARLFNSSLDGNVRRAIDIHQGEDVTSPPSRHSFAKRSPSTVLASRNLSCILKPTCEEKQSALSRLGTSTASPGDPRWAAYVGKEL